MDNATLRDYSETVPYQYEDGKASFMGMEITVDPRVFIPRPETELLVSVVADACREKNLMFPVILDVGTGSGIIPLGLTKLIDSCRVIGVDISHDALDVAKKNVKAFGREANITLARSDMFSSLGDEHLAFFDVIVSNPPYVSHKDYLKLDAWVKAEPRTALYGGEDGMDFYRILAGKGLSFLCRGGLMAVEVGYDQGKGVKALFAENGLTDIKGFKDLNGYERVITGWKNG